MDSGRRVLLTVSFSVFLALVSFRALDSSSRGQAEEQRLLREELDQKQRQQQQRSEPALPASLGCHVDHRDPLPARAKWDAACRLLLDQPKVAEFPAWTLVISSVQSEPTVQRTIDSFADSGVLQHPQLEEIVVYIDSCTCAMTSFLERALRRVAPQMKKRFICHRGVRLPAVAALVALSAVRTPYVLMTGGDRVSVRDAGEDQKTVRRRVSAMLSSGLRMLSDAATPYVLLERLGPTAAEIKQFNSFVQKAEPEVVRAGPGAKVHSEVEMLPRGTVQKRRVMQGLDHCWPACLEVARRSELIRNTVCEPELARGPYVLDCMPVACREWAAYTSGFPQAPVSCATAFYSTAPGAISNKTSSDPSFRTMGSGAVESPLTLCLRVRFWNNGPAMFRLGWYKEKVARRMCTASHALRAGLVVDKKRPTTVESYGRRTNRFLTLAFKRDGYSRCMFGNGMLEASVDQQSSEQFLAKTVQDS
eukprot:TRINITY_DN40141_c0_g1_i1.p1 TRINITY_DN40141_c0_g1~~TRINITY_DN40141_c0_g1_i1.p1  ORF type:complete len:477 (+),score=136.70 TRINITY_DN40141_c0_g1_i1:55-1485(+)